MILFCQKLSNTLTMINILQNENMIPHAGTIFAILGTIPVNCAFGPSITSNCGVRMAQDAALDIIRACLHVFITSNGDVMRAVVHPLKPLKSATHGRDPKRGVSRSRSWLPLNGTSRQRAGLRPRPRTFSPCSRTREWIDDSVDRKAFGLSADRGVD